MLDKPENSFSTARLAPGNQVIKGYRMRNSRAAQIVLESLDRRMLLAASPVLHDLNTSPVDPPDGAIRDLTTLGDAIYFVHGAKSTLWRSKGTSESTVELDGDSDMLPATGVNYLTAADDRLFFASNGDLWVSDGTDAGTERVFDFPVGSSEYRNITSMTWAGDQLYLMCWVAFNNLYCHAELWRSDGTEAGTVPVKTDFALPEQLAVEEMAAHNGKLYFVANDGASGREIWKSDGTLSGTTVVTDFNTSSQVKFSSLTSIGGYLYFRYTGGFEHVARTDGTHAGTVTLVSPTPTTNAVQFASVADKVYFTFNNRIWVTQGTAASTTVARSNTFSNSLKTDGQSIYFVADGKLWKLNAASPSGALLATLPLGGGDIELFGGTVLVMTGGALRTTLSSVDATTGAIQTLADRTARSNPVAPSFRIVGQQAYFILNDALSGKELWRTDGSSVGTSLVKDIYSGNAASAPASFKRLTGGVAFQAERSVLEGHEPWVWLPGEPQPFYLGDFSNGPVDTSASEFVQLNGITYFTAPGSAGRHLYRTDGTAAGTVQIHNTLLAASPEVMSLTVMGDRLYFIARGTGIGIELWVSDGTSTGTQPLGDLFTGAIQATPALLCATENRLFFSAYGIGSGTTLWTSDGTAAGTHQVTPSDPAAAGSTPRTITPVGNKVFYIASSPESGSELWVSDGTPSGTHLVRDLRPGSLSSSLTNLTPYGNKLAFTYGGTLWLTDGSYDGTLVLRAPLNGTLTSLVVVEDTLVFTDNYSLYRSEGTPSSTRLLKTFGGTSTTRVSDLVVVGGSVYVLAFDGVNERAIWQSDGTAPGTRIYFDASSGLTTIPNTISQLTSLESSLVFTADDGVHGSELWRIFLEQSTDVISPAVESQMFSITNKIAVRYVFSESINALSVSLSDLVCMNQTTSAAFSATTFEVSADGRSVEFILPKDLPDGDYLFRLTAGAVADKSGNRTTSDSTLTGSEIFILRGDADGNRTVNFDDLLILAQNYGQSGRTFAAGNFDLDDLGTVTFDDLLILAQRYGNSLPAITATASVPKKRGQRTML